MEGLERKLEIIRDRKKIDEIIGDSQFKALADGGHGLILGEEFGDNRNQYWQDPKTGKISIDYGHNFLHVISNLLPPLHTYVQTSNCEPEIVSKSLELLDKYLDENLKMCSHKHYDINGTTLGIANKVVYSDILNLREFVWELDRIAKEEGINSQEFRNVAGNLINAYKVIQERYDTTKKQREALPFEGRILK